MRRQPFITALLACLALAPLAPARAQTADPQTVVRGRVLDAGTGDGLASATVRLLSLPDSGSAGARDTDGLDPAAAPVVTDEDGGYRFQGLPPGRYLLVVERLGYRPGTVGVRVGRPGRARVSVGLEVEPVALQPVSVRGRAASPYDRAGRSAAGSVPAIRLRLQRYLTPDVRGLTHRDLQETVTLGQTDLFRALQRLPGVSTRDDWTAELWIRGAGWDQTRVVLDGLPLFSPIHGAGLFSGVNADAIGSVYLHPGVRPARLGEGGAAVLELGTRPAEEPGLHGFGELSLVSARVALDQRLDHGGWMVSGRRTYLDWLTGGLETATASGNLAIPYRYTDVTGRADWDLGPETTLEASGIWATDAMTGDVPDVVQGSHITWGNRAGRVTLDAPIGNMRTRHTVGVTAYHAVADTIPVAPEHRMFSAPRINPLEHRLTYAVLRGELLPDAPWDAGYELAHQAVHAVGTPPSPYIGNRITVLDSLRMEDGLTRLSAWLERRWRGGPVELDAGLRAETGSPVRDTGPVRLAPRLRLRWNVADGLTIGIAAGRSHQYAQSPVPIGLPLGVSDTPLFPAGAFWMLAGDSVPALQSDLATVGGELWLGRRTLLSVNGYVRRGAGLLVTDPRQGLAVDRPIYVTAEERARGVEAGVRRVAGRWTGSVGYSLAWADLEAEGLRYPSPQDRRHSIDVTSRLRLTDGLALAAAFSYASGAPYTRFITLQLDPYPEPATPVLGKPNARRMAAYASLDLSLDWTKRFEGWSLGLFLQVRNALNRANTASYIGSQQWSCGEEATERRDDGLYCFPSGRRAPLRDEFLMAIPTMPLIGLRLRF